MRQQDTEPQGMPYPYKALGVTPEEEIAVVTYKGI